MPPKADGSSPIEASTPQSQLATGSKEALVDEDDGSGSESAPEKSSSEDAWSEKAADMSEDEDSDDDSVRRRRKKKIRRKKAAEEEKLRKEAEEREERERIAREEEEEEDRKRAEEAVIVSKTAALAGMRGATNNRRTQRGSVRQSVRMSVTSGERPSGEFGGSLESARKAFDKGENLDELAVEDVKVDGEAEHEDQDDDSWKDDAELAQMSRFRRVLFQCCRIKSRLRRFRRVRRRFKKRYHRCCRPCGRVIKFFDRLWIRFEDAFRVVAWLTKCFFCPLFLLSRCCFYCLDCPRYHKSEENESVASMERSSRLSTTGGRSSVSSMASNVYEAEEGMDETASDASRRQAEERRSTLPERSRLKRPRPRAQKDQVVQHQGHSHTTNARQKFRQMTGRGDGLEDFSAQAEYGKEGIIGEDEEPKFSFGDLHWSAYLPWNWYDIYELWKASRKGIWEKLDQLLSTLEEEDEWDFDNLDQNGMPTHRVPTRPKWVRRNTRIFIFAYWDPLLDNLPTLTSVLLAMRWLVLIVPISVLGVFVFWLLASMQRNAEYVEGDCQIESLPIAFKTEKGIETTVIGIYSIRRFYKASSQKTEGSVVQECSVTVPCWTEDLGRGDNDKDDTCDSFEMWARNQEVLCYYKEEDYYGDKNTQVFCLGLPSDLKQESFGVIVSGLALCFSIFMSFAIVYRRILQRRAAMREKKEIEQKEAEEKAVLQARVDAEALEAEKQAAKAKTDMETDGKNEDVDWDNIQDDEDSGEHALA